MRYESFAPLAAQPNVVHAFTVRTTEDSRDDAHQTQLLAAFGYPPAMFAAAEQVHGAGVGIVRTATGQRAPGVDALVTDVPGVPLLIRCADCAAVFIVDRCRPAIGLAHSGRAGTQANIVGATLAAMRSEYGTVVGDCQVVISPSIGPCHYEMDIWAGIETQLHEAGVPEVYNPRVCTACHLSQYYSYRAEKGQTGRMIALLAIRT